MSNAMVTTSDRSDRTRLVLVTNTGWAMFRFRGWLIERLIARGWDVVAIADYSDGFRDDVEKLGANAIQVSLSSSGLNPFRDLKYIATLMGHYRRLRPDLLQHYTIKPVIYGSLCCRLLGLRRVVNGITGLGIAFAPGQSILFQMVRLLYRVCIPAHAEIIFQNPVDREQFKERRVLTTQRTHLISGSGVDTDLLVPDESTPFEERRDVVMACRMLWSKGVAEFVEAARELHETFPDKRFVLIGGAAGDYGSKNPDFVSSEWLREHTNSDWLVWLGRVPPDEVEDLYRRAYCAVLPSTYPEGVPRTLLEATSAGLPVVTTDHPGCRDAVEDGVSGYLVSPDRRTEDLIRSLRTLLASPETAAEFGQASRRLACERFDTSVFLARMLAIYERLLGQDKPNRLAS